MADIFRGPLQVNRREVDPRFEVRHYVLPSLLTTVLVVAAVAPFTPNATASAPERPRYVNADTSHGTPKALYADAQAPVFVAPHFAPQHTAVKGWLPADTTRGQPITLQVVVPPPPVVNPPHLSPLRFPWLPASTAIGTAKVLYADAQLPFRTLHHTPPDATRPVTDTTRGTSLALLTFVAPPLPPGNALFVAVPPWPYSISDTTMESPPVAIQGVQPAPPVPDATPTIPLLYYYPDGHRPRSVETETVEIVKRKPKAPTAPKPYADGAPWRQYVETKPKWIREAPPKVVAAVRKVAEKAPPEPAVKGTADEQRRSDDAVEAMLADVLRQRQIAQNEIYMAYVTEARNALAQIRLKQRQQALALLLMMANE